MSEITKGRAKELAAQTLQIEADALLALRQRLITTETDDFVKAVQILLSCEGRIVVTGIGKSGHIGHKIAATLASTGSPAMFVHPSEAAHGDLGMITEKDVLIAISYSGESEELSAILPLVKRMGAPIVALTGHKNSSLAKISDVHLSVHVEKEACPLNLAPTSSTTTTLALGDTLAIALLDAKGFRREDFARSHPGGALGRRLLTRVKDVMKTGDAIPAVLPHVPLTVALLEMSRKGLAMTTVVDSEYKILGIFTDGDLRRLIETKQDLVRITIGEVMTKNPRTITEDRLAVDAVGIMEQYRIGQLPVIDAENKLVGAIHIHDLTRAKVI